jgi:hypothetical protein
MLMTFRSIGLAVATLVAMGCYGCSSNAPPPEAKGSAESHLDGDDDDSAAATGDDDDSSRGAPTDAPPESNPGSATGGSAQPGGPLCRDDIPASQAFCDFVNYPADPTTPTPTTPTPTPDPNAINPTTGEPNWYPDIPPSGGRVCNSSACVTTDGSGSQQICRASGCQPCVRAGCRL